MIYDQTFAGADKLEQRVVSALSPTKLRLPAFEVVNNDYIVGSQRLGSGAAELLGHADFEPARLFQGLL